jgi:hypothetical protein
MPDSAAGASQSAFPGEQWLFSLPRERAKVVVKADLLPALSVLSTVSLLGLPLGWLWSILAPPQRMRVISTTESPVPLELESWHRFDDLIIYVLLSFGAGLVVGAVVWLLRQRRGPVILFAAVAGSALSAWLGTLLATAFANGRYEITTPPALGDVVTQAPQISSLWVLLAQPFAAALVYGFFTLRSGQDDLGRRLS